MAKHNRILDDLFRRQPDHPITPIKVIRFKRALSGSFIAHEDDLRGLTVRVDRFFAAVKKLCDRPKITQEEIATDLIGKQVTGNPPSILTNWKFDTPERPRLTLPSWRPTTPQISRPLLLM